LIEEDLFGGWPVSVRPIILEPQHSWMPGRSRRLILLARLKMVDTEAPGADIPIDLPGPPFPVRDRLLHK